MNALPLFSKRLHLLQPLPGSRLFDGVENRHVILEALRFSEAAIPTRHLSIAELNRIYREMISYFYEDGPVPSFG
jgi:hypothetical protein